MNWQAAPESGRPTLVEALRYLQDVAAPHIVEVGTSRRTDPEKMLSDGWATRVFAWYVATFGGLLTTVDRDPAAIRACQEICRPWAGSVEFVVASAMDAVPSIASIDLLYMDGPVDARYNLQLYRALRANPRFVLFDDIIGDGPWTGHCKSPSWYAAAENERPWGPRGTLAIPAMIEDGYRIVFDHGHQVLLELG